MKFKLSLFFAFLSTGIAAQNDAAITVRGEIKEISVNPDNAVWLVSNSGEVYSTTNLGDDFKTVLKLPEPKPDFFGEKSINQERVTFFSSDTLFISGYLGNDLKGEERGNTNKVFCSYDGGQVWNIQKFDNSGSWIYDCYSNDKGEAWMGGSSGDIYYTGDYAKSWTKVTSPFGSKERTAAIAVSDKYVFVGALRNELMRREREAKKFKKIPSPLDQKAYAIPKNEAESSNVRHRFYKLDILWDSIVVVNQHHNIFYSNVNKIKWTKLEPELVSYSIDKSSNTLYGVTKENALISFDSNFTNPKELFNIPADEVVVDIKANNGALFTLVKKLAPAKKGDDVIGTVGKMQITRVGYRKASAYILYKTSSTGTIQLEMHLRK